MQRDKPRLLMIGPMSTEIGGTTISFAHLRKSLEESGLFSMRSVSTEGIRGAGWKAPFRYLRLLWRIFCAALKSDVVSLHAIITGVPFLGLPVLFICRLLRRPLLFRLFGGADYRDDALGAISRPLTKLFFKSTDLYLAQTQQLVTNARQDGMESVEWYPTARPLPEPSTVELPTGPCRRFVFIGQIKIEKGLRELVEATADLPPDAVVHVYGPWYDLPRDTFEPPSRVSYQRVLEPAEVAETIAQYDAVILPSYLPHEGYSGVIIEAFGSARPVIATRWNALGEIVKDGETGLLVEPRDATSLSNAMRTLMDDTDLYRRLSRGSFEFSKEFTTERAAERFIAAVRRLQK